MTDPNQGTQLGGNRFHPSTLPTTSKYTFSHLFLPDTTQGEFFTKTTLPLVNDVLSGQNALLFAYGVTNSGKTYTVHGGTEEGSAGIVPRTLDVIFNSVQFFLGLRQGTDVNHSIVRYGYRISSCRI
jgi:kinesin family protein 20